MANNPTRGFQIVFPVFTIAKYNRCKTKILQGAEREHTLGRTKLLPERRSSLAERQGVNNLYMYVCARVK